MKHHNYAKALVTFFCILFCGTSWGEPAWPEKPIRIVIPFTSGGSMDVIGRALASGLTKSLNTSVYVENRPGAGGAIGAQEVARATPDGYTLLLGNTGTQVTNPLTIDRVGYDPVKDFVPIRFIQMQPLFLAVNNKLPIESVRDLLAYTKQKGTPLTIGAPGNAHRITIANFAKLTGLSVDAIPYKGPSPAINDLMGGHIDAIFDTGMALLPLQQQKSLRIIGIGTLKRSAEYPEIPTLAEQGAPGFETIGTNSLYAPKGTPQPIVDRLNSEVEKIVNSASVQDAIKKSAGISVNQGPSELAAWQARTTLYYRQIIQQNNLKFN